MCGIYGILLKNNKHNIKTLIIQALNLLKNRGYDSCGVYLDKHDMEVMKKFGFDDHSNQDIFVLLEESLKNCDHFTRGIGHTRWATHGEKNNVNSHPHTSQNEQYVIVHNGIISNYNELKKDYLKNEAFKSTTDSEVIIHLIEYFNIHMEMIDVLKKLDTILEGTWACLIIDKSDHNRIYFLKNQNPLLIGDNEDSIIFTSEPIGFLNSVNSYTLLREHCYGYYDTTGKNMIMGDHMELPLIKLSFDECDKGAYQHWMRKEIDEQANLNVLMDPLTKQRRYQPDGILLNLDWIESTKYLYLVGCGSSYYAGLIASDFFRRIKAFEFVNVFDGAEFGVQHLEALENPERDLLVVLISQSGETSDLNLATTICREFSRKKKQAKGEIKILGIINVIGSLISRRTIDNLYTNCGRENAVASTKSCTAQILACLLLALYKSKMNKKLETTIEKKFITDLNMLPTKIQEVLILEEKIRLIAHNILKTKHQTVFILGRDELRGAALEGSLKIKEIAYLHAEGFHVGSLKHGAYALVHDQVPVIILYHEYTHSIKSVIEELKTRHAMIILISSNLPDETHINSLKLPTNHTFHGILSVIVLQLLAYQLSVLQGINPDTPRNLAKVVTVD